MMREFMHFGLKGQMPSDVVEKLEYLYKVSSLEEIQENTEEAVNWLDKLT